jgi:hypothetical protein
MAKSPDKGVVINELPPTPAAAPTAPVQFGKKEEVLAGEIFEPPAPPPPERLKFRPFGPMPRAPRAAGSPPLKTFRVSLPKFKSLLLDDGGQYLVDALDIEAIDKHEAVSLFIKHNGITNTMHRFSVQEIEPVAAVA